jgi:hypothetical protein
MVPRVLLAPSAHTKRSRGAWDGNGEHLDRGREKAGSRTDRTTVALKWRQKELSMRNGSAHEREFT